MNFRLWLVTNFIDDNSPMGDLAKDISNDKNFPETDSYEDLSAYLESRTCQESFEAFKSAYDLYKSCM